MVPDKIAITGAGWESQAILIRTLGVGRVSYVNRSLMGKYSD